MIEGEASRRVLLSWVKATWIGWLLGLPIIIALAVVSEGLGVGGAQVFVGAGMGAGVGILQARAIKGVLNKPGRWFWSCVIGLAAPFLATDIASAAGLGSIYSLYASVAAGGLLVGAWQAKLLRQRFKNSSWWIAASLLGWSVAGGTVAAASWLTQRRQVRGLWGLAAYLGVVAIGGLILGLATGMALAWMVRREQSSTQPQHG